MKNSLKNEDQPHGGEVVKKSEPKYIFVTGGVVSSLGKGVAASSIGCLLESRGLRVTLQKCDPYLNVDPGTMSPYQHGEVYVTDDGAETDLDLGHYERFTSAHLTRDNNWTTGRIYESILSKERRGDFLGKTVQVIPHVTDEIKAAFRKIAHDVDVVIIEIGGTVGDIESLPFLEAIRQMRLELGPENTLFVHVTLVPFIPTAGELKTKPTQHSVKEMLSIGIQPDLLLCRSDRPLPHEMKAKIALFCNIPEKCVVTARDVDTIYAVPVNLAGEGLDEQILRLLKLEAAPRDMSRWLELLDNMEHPRGEVRIGVVGKYVALEDAYKSLREALMHGGLPHHMRTVIEWIEAEEIDSPETAARRLAHVDGVLVPGRIREARHSGNDLCHSIRAGAQGAVLWHLPGNAVRDHRIRAQRGRTGRREQHGIRSADAASRDLQAARTAGRGRDGRHDAAGGMALPDRAGLVRKPGIWRDGNQRTAPSPL